MELCRGGALTPNDLELFHNKPQLCESARSAWPILVHNKVDPITVFARDQQELGEAGALNFAITAVKTNAHLTKLRPDAEAMGVDPDQMLEAFARLVFLTTAVCTKEARSIVDRCSP